jgi:hypothetical protein
VADHIRLHPASPAPARTQAGRLQPTQLHTASPHSTPRARSPEGARVFSSSNAFSQSPRSRPPAPRCSKKDPEPWLGVPLLDADAAIAGLWEPARNPMAACIDDDAGASPTRKLPRGVTVSSPTFRTS